MDEEYRIDADRCLVVVKTRGEMTASRCLSLMQGIMADAAYRPGFSMVWDFRDASLGLLRSHDLYWIRDCLEQLQERRGRNYRVALVVERDLDFGVSRMFQAISADLPMYLQVFRQFDAAHEWIAGAADSSAAPANGMANGANPG